MEKKYLGMLTISPTGLRKMANWLQKKTYNKGDSLVKGFICNPSRKGKKMKCKTFGIEL